MKPHATTARRLRRKAALASRRTPHAEESLRSYGIHRAGSVFWNWPAPALYEAALVRREGQLAEGGALIVKTGLRTGRSPDDKFFVKESSSDARIGWGKINRPFEAERFERLRERVAAYLKGKELFVQDCFVGADPRYQRSVRFITEEAWHSLFARTMFSAAAPIGADGSAARPEFTLLHVPNFQAQPQRDGTRSSAFILIHLGKKLVLIGGTHYAGEIKKAVFTIMNYLLPLSGVLSMHCSANSDSSGKTALFFGLSGTGKTSLSADTRRTLIGDDEHGWSEEGIFNFENGCYAKMIRLSPGAEPEIFATSRRFGTVLENVVMDPRTRALDLDDETLTENTRGAYPLTFIPNASQTRMGGHPCHLILLTCDAFGILPPIARLTPEQAMYHFISGYTAKVAGTEQGVTEPKATFSACFGAPFMALPPSRYAELLGGKIAKHRVSCWLINTGWTGGPYGEGSRIPIGYTRAMAEAALSGALAQAPMEQDPVFGIAAVRRCPGVPDSILEPRSTWKEPRAFDAKAKELAAQFRENFMSFAADQPEQVRRGGPLA